MSKKLIPIKYIEELDKYIPKKDYIDLPPGQPLLGDDRYKKIYHTTSLNSFLLIWAKKRLKFAPLTGVNDMKEKLLSISGENPQLLPMLFAMDDVKRSYRQISFTMDFDTKNKGCTSPLMWGVYGDKNNGVCIELDYEKLKLPENCLCGIVTDRDILLRTVACDKDVKATPVSEIMTTNVCTCGCEQNIDEAQNVMAKNQIRRIPVVDNTNKIVGILTMGDLAKNDKKIGEQEVCKTIEDICNCKGTIQNYC